MKKFFESIYFINVFVLLIVGFFSFLRYSEVTDLLVPRKVKKVFSVKKSLGTYSFLLYLDEDSEPVEIDRKLAPTQSLKFSLYFQEFTFFNGADYGHAKTIVLKTSKQLDGYKLIISNPNYYIYEKI